ncbi:MAG: hypothetical protein ACOC95_01535 [Planctomycetota bacterium]
MEAQSPPAPPAPPAIPPAPADGRTSPLTGEQMQAVVLARRQAAKLRSAAKVALVNGVLLAVFSGLSLLFVLGEAVFGSFDAVGAVMCVGLGALAWNELRGRRLLRRFSLRAPSVLGWNQVMLLGLIVAYAAWMMASALLGPNPYDEVVRRVPQAARLVGDMGRLYRVMAIALYGGLIVGTLIFQGLNARYYFTRARLLRSYLARTPAWVVDLQRLSGGAGPTGG